jgi:hypothetical protein
MGPSVALEDVHCAVYGLRHAEQAAPAPWHGEQASSGVLQLLVPYNAPRLLSQQTAP